MSGGKKRQIKCLVCGAVFEEGTSICPVCGAGPESFVPFEEKEKAFHRDTEEHFLILGGGQAGLSAAKAIRERNFTASIVMATNEEIFPYNRPMLTKSMMGKNNREQLLVHDASWYEANRIIILTKKTAKKVDPINREVAFTDGICLKYDKLIYALGSECFIPPIPGHEKEQVVAIRRITDTEKICALLPKTRQAVVIGGGVLGLEAAWALKKEGILVTVLELSPQLMARQLDAGASKFLESLVREAGIDIRLNVTIDAIVGEPNVTGIRLGDGTIIPAELVVVSAGVRANVELARDAGAEIGKSVKVNSFMETAIPHVYACGDCAEYEGINYAIWPQAMQMGKIAGANAAGDKSAYQTVLAALTFIGMKTSLFAVGDVGKIDGKTYKIEHKEDTDKKIYKTWYYMDGKLTGAILIGDTKEMQSVADELGQP